MFMSWQMYHQCNGISFGIHVSCAWHNNYLTIEITIWYYLDSELLVWTGFKGSISVSECLPGGLVPDTRPAGGAAEHHRLSGHQHPRLHLYPCFWSQSNKPSPGISEMININTWTLLCLWPQGCLRITVIIIAVKIVMWPCGVGKSEWEEFICS